MLYPNRGVEPQRSRSDRLWLRLLPSALFVLLVVLVYVGPLFGPRIFVGRDLLPYGYPLERATHDALARGRLPTWNADVSGGRPLFPNPNSASLYPLRPLLSPLPFPDAMRIFPVFHWALAGLGAMRLLRALSASRAGSWIGGVTYAFSGVMVSQVFYLPLQAGVALLPWALFALVRTGSTPGRKTLGIAAAWALLLLGGDAFSHIVAFLASVLWILIGVPRGTRGRETGHLALGLALGALAAAPQIVATALLAPETQRAVIPLRVREVLRYTLAPWRLLELVVPYPLGDVWTLEDHWVWSRGPFQFFYATLYAGALAPAGLVVLARRSGPAARYTMLLFLGGVILAAAGSFVPEAWGPLRSPVPLRYPEKFSVAIALALALAAGLGLDRLRERSGRIRWIAGIAAGLAAVAAVAALFPLGAGRTAVGLVGALPFTAPEAALLLPGALAEGGLYWILTWSAVALLRRGHGASSAAALAMLTAIPILATRRIVPAEHEACVFPPTAFAQAVAKRDPEGAYRTIDEAVYYAPSPLEPEGNRAGPWGTAPTRNRWGYHAQSLWGRGTIFNVDVDRGDLSRLDSLRLVSVWAASQPGGAPFFSAISLRFGLRFRDQAPLPGYARFGGDSLQSWDENPEALPDIRLLEGWREEDSGLDALKTIPRLAPGEIVLETGRDSTGSAPPGNVKILERSPERLRLDVAAPREAWLFVLRGFWGYRTIRIDGAPVEAVPAQLAFSAVRIPAGRHLVDWREEVPGLEVSRFGPVLFALAAVALAWRRPRGIPA